jgi:hypothetical protein
MTHEEMNDFITELNRGFYRVSTAITADASPGRDATGRTVGSLTESVMGVTSGLVKIADAIERLAEAVELHKGGAV